VLHLLVHAVTVTVTAGGIDLGEEVINDVVGALEDVVGDSTSKFPLYRGRA
jgi:hypothetical protein